MPVSQPLASWSDGPTKSAILDFVACVTKQGGPEFAPPVERIATFDNDGTLCCEQPLQIQFHFAFDRVKELSAKDPAMAERPVFKAVLERDYNTLFGLGSSVKLRFDSEGGRASLTKLPELNIFNDREAKPQSIGLHIGRRPLLAFGNSDGDLAMVRYAKSGSAPRLALLLHHDDADREAAYDRKFRLSPLAEALDRAEDYGITVVSMKRDWNAVF
jgi:hypothetical protein